MVSLRLQHQFLTSGSQQGPIEELTRAEVDQNSRLKDKSMTAASY